MLTSVREIKSNFDNQNIDINVYITLEKELEKLNIKIKTLQELTEKKQSILKNMSKKLDELTKIRHSRFIKRREKAGIIQEKIDFIQLSVEYRQEKEGFLLFLTDLLKGKSIRKEKINKLINGFNNGYDLFTAIMERDKKLSDLLTETDFLNITDRFKEYMFGIITYQPEDKLLITYQVGSTFKEIEKLSIGQRAAGLLAIILSQSDKSIIIDQPEDDIDNNTNYEGIIKTLLEKKCERQFIFATHNPNIVVLGDSDNVIVCKSEKDRFTYEQGSIDRDIIQKEIVNIMEGGKEAFERRKSIYNMWG